MSTEIYDIGYRHYDGPRLGSGHTNRALIVHSLRGVFGLGRAARSKIVPFMLAVIMVLPAVVTIAMMALLKERDLAYSAYTVIMQPVVAIFMAAQAPTQVGPDLRYRVLPLYMSRPVSVLSYVGAKVVAMTVALFLIVAVPLVLMFAGELLVDMPGPPATGEFLGALTTALVLAILLATVSLAIASLTPRRGLGVASVSAVYLLSLAAVPVIYGTLLSMNETALAKWAWLLNPFWLVDAVQVWLFNSTPSSEGGYPAGPVPALLTLAFIAIGLGVLALRYRKAAAQ
ncbi:ABC transporter permease [Nonomuraea typhae]|uniref:ABC transporter permease n=1 Tax=Nonomuraea typhae TaxID=2603600 RepID=A0ABW7ZCP7_9ACTN